MKAVILAGGFGTRIGEETHLTPKPMIEIGGKPILWHIMKLYSTHGINHFIICLGYKGYLIKEYFANYYRHMSDITYNLANNQAEIHNNYSENWKVTLVDTGEEAMTGARIKKIAKYVQDDEAFCLTYGDGVANINITKLVQFHKSHGKLATVTASQPPARFGAIQLNEESRVTQFSEKPPQDDHFISSGFFVLNPQIINYIKEGQKAIWEQESLPKLAKAKELMAYKNYDFWYPMDTLRDKIYLENLWQSGKAPWKIW
jgi:glucose-1-phosphate cytidylyltransferase